MEAEIQQILVLMFSSMTASCWDTGMEKLAKLAGIELNSYDDRIKLAEWLHGNYNDAYLTAKANLCGSDWIFTLEEFEKRLAAFYSSKEVSR